MDGDGHAGRRLRHGSASGSPQVVIAEPTTPANLLNFTEYYETADAKAPAAKEARRPRKVTVAKAAEHVHAIAAAARTLSELVHRHRIQRMYGYTSYQFGTAPGDTSPVTPYAP